MKQIRSTKRTIGLACLTLLSAAILSATGAHWFATSKIIVSAGSPDPTGARFVASVYNRRTFRPRLEIRDVKTGGLRCDLNADTNTVVGRSGKWCWSSDGKKLGAVSRTLNQTRNRWETSAVVLDVSKPKAHLLREWSIPTKRSPIGLAFDADDRLVHVNFHKKSNGRSQLEVVRNGVEVLSSIELGKDESVSSLGRGLSLEILNSGWKKTNPDLLVGTPEAGSVTIQISTATGKIIGKYEKGIDNQNYIFPGPLNSNLVYNYVYNQDVPPYFEVLKFDDPANPVRTIALPEGADAIAPISLPNEKYLFQLFDDEGVTVPRDLFPSKLLIVDSKAGSNREIKLPPKSRLHSILPAGQVFLVNQETKRIIRLDLETEEQTLVVDYNRGTKACGITALVGVPLLWFVFWLVGSRDTSPHPFLDMAFLLGVTAIIAVLWCVFGLRIIVPGDTATICAAIYGIAFALFGVAWAFHSDSFFRIGIPVLIVAYAVGVAVVLFWSQGNPWHAFEETAAGALLIGWQLFGLSFYRYGGGRLIGKDVQENTSSRASQISIRHVMFFVGACALLFAVLRFVVLDRITFGSGVTQYAIFVIVLVGLAAGLSIASLRSVAYFRRGWLGLICYVAIAVLACVVHYYATIRLDTSWSQWNIAIRYTVVSVAGLLNWFAFAYCERHLRTRSKYGR